VITLDRPPEAPTPSPKTPVRRGRKPDRATQYALDVTSGAIVAGQYVRLACQRHLDLLDLVASKTRTDLRWNRAEAEAVFTFFGHLQQYQGRWAGQPLELLDWEAFVVGSVFGWQLYDPQLRRWVRLYREAYARVARKCGKSSIAGGVGLWMLDFDGESGAQVYSVATKREAGVDGRPADGRAQPAPGEPRGPPADRLEADRVRDHEPVCGAGAR
jgi:hypothetical protein